MIIDKDHELFTKLEVVNPYTGKVYPLVTKVSTDDPSFRMYVIDPTAPDSRPNQILYSSQLKYSPALDSSPMSVWVDTDFDLVYVHSGIVFMECRVCPGQ